MAAELPLASMISPWQKSTSENQPEGESAWSWKLSNGDQCAGSAPAALQGWYAEFHGGTYACPATTYAPKSTVSLAGSEGIFACRSTLSIKWRIGP